MLKITRKDLPNENDSFYRVVFKCDDEQFSSLTSKPRAMFCHRDPEDILRNIKETYRQNLRDFAKEHNCCFCENATTMMVINNRHEVLRRFSDISYDGEYTLTELLDNPDLLPGGEFSLEKRLSKFIEWEYYYLVGSEPAVIGVR